MSNDEDIPGVTSFVTLSTFTEYVKSRCITSRDPRYKCSWTVQNGTCLPYLLNVTLSVALSIAPVVQIENFNFQIDIGAIHHEIYCAISLASSRCGIHSHCPSGDMYLAL